MGGTEGKKKGWERNVRGPEGEGGMDSPNFRTLICL